jgi:hypothetical protein
MRTRRRRTSPPRVRGEVGAHRQMRDGEGTLDGDGLAESPLTRRLRGKALSLRVEWHA